MSFWVAGATVVGNVAGAAIQGDAARSAARTQQQAADAAARVQSDATAEQRRQYDQTRADFQPWRTVGVGAVNRLDAESNYFNGSAYLSANPDVAAAGMDPYQHYLQYGRAEGRAATPGSNFQASPDYQFRRDQGTQGIGNSFAARGGAASGNALKALAEFNSNLASGEYGNWWNRQAGLAGVGQSATGSIAQAGQSAAQAGQVGANNLSTLFTGAGDARASGIVGQGNAYANALTQLGGLAGSYKSRDPRTWMGW